MPSAATASLYNSKMVSVVQLRPQAREQLLDLLVEGLAREEHARVAQALEFAEPIYEGEVLSTGEPTWPHALGIAANLAAIGADPETRIAGILFAAPKHLGGLESIEQAFGGEIAALAGGVEKLYRLRLLTRGKENQDEVLRKMVLGMVEDIRVVLIRLASRTQTLRWFSKQREGEHAGYARETLDIYAPLANRLGVWQLKWELEDLSFRFIEPEVYKRLASNLDEKRLEREQYIADAMRVLGARLEAAGVQARLAGRPKHIYSIWNKMRTKALAFEDVHDVRALRVIVATPQDCYAALGVVHDLWQPIPQEFDDYISRPKGNEYQSLHTAVSGPGGRILEVQIRTEEMHRHAEFGVAAHWRYKEGGPKSKADGAFERKIAWLRQLLAWRDEVAESSGKSAAAGGSADWAASTREAGFDDTVYALTPQGRVVDLPAGATPVDFAYALHTDLGHRCRGAKVDGQIVTLDTPLASGQCVEVVVAKAGGPSRDWLNPERGFVKSNRARQKIRQWFNSQSLAETVAAGRAIVEKELKREGGAQANLDALAAKLRVGKAEDLFIAVAREEINLRQLHTALRAMTGATPAVPVAPRQVQPPKPRKASGRDHGVLVVGVGQLLTQLAKCCKPVPPDPIRGFVTREKGVSIHREDCASLRNIAESHPERLIDAAWGSGSGAAYNVDMHVTSNDRQGLLRDIGDALARERINVTAVSTQSKDDLAYMRFTFEVADLAQLKRAFAIVKEVPGVIRVSRG
jgi:GTP pyrophosphokinase